MYYKGGRYYGDDEISLKEVVENGPLDCDLEQVILDTLYCAYHAVPVKRRPEILYEIIKNADRDEITLEAVMQHGGEELPEFQEFLTLLVAYLGDKKGGRADRLIVEAAALLDDVSLVTEYAQKFVKIHPGLYLEVLENRLFADVDKMISIGREAIKQIPKSYIIRSKAALKTAEYVIEAGGNQALLEKCYFAACESDTSVRNYLRVLLNGFDSGTKREKAQKILMEAVVSNSSSSYSGFYESSVSERKENTLDKNTFLLLQFFDGQFEEVLKKGLYVKEALGWTGTFMKQGIALFLLSVYEGSWNGKGILRMADIVKIAMNFSAEEYQKIICEPSNTEEKELFYELFLKWKSLVPMEPDVRDRVIKKITNLLEKRTAGIMEANRRNYYRECAAYLAALGEVRESLGEKGAKHRLLLSYKEKYPRRTSFRAGLRNYGL